MEFSINKGIGKPPEFQGLKAQYLFIFAGGLLSLFVVFAIMHLAGVNPWLCVIIGAISALILVYGVFYLNAKFGEHGLMKAQARRRHPRYIINRRSFSRLFQLRNIKYELQI